MTSPELARDPDAFIQHLDSQLDMLIRRSATLEALAGSGAASHPSGAVTVEFGSGGTLQQVAVAPMWEQHLTAGELTAAITETILRARDGEGVIAAPAELRDDEVAAIRERRLAEVRAQQSAPRSEGETQALVDSLPRTLDELNRSFARLLERVEQFRARISEEPVEVHTRAVLSTNQMVALEVAQGVVVGASVRESWAAGKSGPTITECFDEAIQQLPTILGPVPGQ